MTFLFDDEPEKTEKADKPRQEQDGSPSRPQRNKPPRRFWITLAVIAVIINISVTWTKEQGAPYSPFESLLVTVSFLYLFVFAFSFLAGMILKAPDPEDGTRTVADKLRANRAARRAEQEKPFGNSKLSMEEQRILEEMEASMVPKKDQYDVIVFRDIWRFWEKDGRSAN